MQPLEDRRQSSLRAQLESTNTPFSVAHFEQRAVIFLEGDACDSVMHVEQGRVRLSVTARNGKEAICGLLGAGAFLGEELLGGRAVRLHTATALTAAEVLVVEKAQMVRLVRTKPAIADQLLAHLLTRHACLEADLSDQLLNPCERRLARTLLVLAGCSEGRPCRCVLPDVSQEIIAEMVGTTRTRVNVFMGRFKKLGFIVKDGGRLLVNPGLFSFVEEDSQSVSNGTCTITPQALPSEMRDCLEPDDDVIAGIGMGVTSPRGRADGVNV